MAAASACTLYRKTSCGQRQFMINIKWRDKIIEVPADDADALGVRQGLDERIEQAADEDCHQEEPPVASTSVPRR